MSDHPPFIFRPLESRDDYTACVSLQREIWGDDFLDVVPATLLMVSQRVGGVAAGAFEGQRKIVGFVFGISGVRSGRLAHWSDMLAVSPAARRRGVGRQLKVFQRTLLLEQGIEVAHWSFDPLRADNANFNLNVLGARPGDYVVDMYGDTGSSLHRGLDTDRLVAEWRLNSTDVEARLEGARPPLPHEAHDAPIADPPPPTRTTAGRQNTPFPTDRWVRITIPANIDRLKSTAPDDARRCQLSVRRAFEWYFEKGYSVVGFQAAGDPDAPWYAVTNRPVRSEQPTPCLSK